jgi:WD40 repeat protein/biotin carboxyl carrier protein
MRTQKIVFFLLGMIAITNLACSNNAPGTVKPGATQVPRFTKDSFGGFVFVPLALPPLETAASGIIDPIIVPLCHLTVIDKMDVSSNVDGTIRWLGIESKASEVVDSKDFLVHRGKFYRRLRVGDKVEENQVLVLLDDRQAYVEMDTAFKNYEGSKAEIEASSRALIAIRKVEQIEKESQGKGASTLRDVNNAITNTAKFEADHAKTLSTGKQKEGEYERAKIKWEQHFLRAAISGEVAQIIKQAGEGVKAAETVLHIQNIDRLTVEGYLDLQYEPQVKVGSTVTIEPAMLAPPVQERAFHAGKPVSAIAVTTVKGSPLIVTGGENGMANVWDPKDAYAKVAWNLKLPVRAIACTRPGLANPLALIGCDDGHVRIYELNDLKAEPRLLDGRHEGGVQAIAISPDGTNCVTADERGDIFLWDVGTGKQKYRFTHEHNSSVSALHFTPQCTVVSVGRDNVALVWKVGASGAYVEHTFENRTGDVGNLGVSEDGSFLAIDQYRDRINLVELGDGRTIGTLHQAGDSAKFTGCALVSPKIGKENHRLILTSGGAEGVLQLWRRPGSRGRASELRKLISKDYSPVTAAAFSPTGEKGFIVGGTKKGDILVWSLPTEEELLGSYEARVTHVDRTVDPSGKTVRIFADFDNPDEKTGRRLRPGTTATMVIIPQAK